MRVDYSLPFSFRFHSYLHLYTLITLQTGRREDLVCRRALSIIASGEKSPELVTHDMCYLRRILRELTNDRRFERLRCCALDARRRNEHNDDRLDRMTRKESKTHEASHSRNFSIQVAQNIYAESGQHQIRNRHLRML